MKGRFQLPKLGNINNQPLSKIKTILTANNPVSSGTNKFEMV